MKFNGPKVKLSRKLGIPLTSKAARYMEKKSHPPGMHGLKRRRRQSNYGRQLVEKQRLRFQYNVSERQLRNYYKRATRMKGVTGDNLVGLLETRLDAVVHRAFAPSVFAARQFVGHGHILVNGRRVNIPSFRVKEGDVVEVREKSRRLRCFNEPRGVTVPTYVETDETGYQATLRNTPVRDEVPIVCEVPLVIEYYSR